MLSKRQSGDAQKEDIGYEPIHFFSFTKRVKRGRGLLGLKLITTRIEVLSAYNLKVTATKKVKLLDKF